MKKILLILIFIFMLSACKEKDFVFDTSEINVFDKTNVTELDYEIHSHGYELIDMSNYKVLKAKNIDDRIYPASLTKLLTLDTVLNYVDDLSLTSSISDEQVYDLILEDASLAYIETDYDYTIKELLYALVLPSGADGALALENYFNDNGMNLIDKMNEQALTLGCKNSHFVNTTGLHDDNHYTCLSDLCLIVLDILKFEQGKEILETTKYTLTDGKVMESSIMIVNGVLDGKILGGKTGYTPEAGQNIIVLYREHNRSYLLLLCNAMGSASNRQYFHFEDAYTILDADVVELDCRGAE